MSDPAEVFHPGVYLKEEIEAREWTWRAFEDESGIDYATLTLLIFGNEAVTPELAEKIAAAFGTSPEMWLNLQASWDARHHRPTELIPHEAEIQAMLVASFQRMKDIYGVRADLMLGCDNGDAQYIEGVYDVVSLIYGIEQATRLYDAAKAEAGL